MAQQPFGFCLNTSTLRGQRLGIVREIEIAAAAGYQGIEPWISELEEYEQGGGSLEDLRRRIEDAGLQVAGAIGFAEWIVDDAPRRATGLEVARRDMERVRAIGGRWLAAPPAGAQAQEDLDLTQAAARYRTLLELGATVGVTPLLEVWGHSKTLSRLADAMQVAVASQHSDAALLLDVYHLYKGGSGYDALHLVAGGAMPLLHINDFPGRPDRRTITDADRVFPGDGVAPLRAILQTLRDTGFCGMLSLELFNEDYWQLDPGEVASSGLEKMQAVVAAALGGF